MCLVLRVLPVPVLQQFADSLLTAAGLCVLLGACCWGCGQPAKENWLVLFCTTDSRYCRRGIIPGLEEVCQSITLYDTHPIRCTCAWHAIQLDTHYLGSTRSQCSNNPPLRPQTAR